MRHLVSRSSPLPAWVRFGATRIAFMWTVSNYHVRQTKLRLQKRPRPWGCRAPTTSSTPAWRVIPLPRLAARDHGVSMATSGSTASGIRS